MEAWAEQDFIVLAATKVNSLVWCCWLAEAEGGTWIKAGRVACAAVTSDVFCSRPAAETSTMAFRMSVFAVNAAVADICISFVVSWRTRFR